MGGALDTDPASHSQQPGPGDSYSGPSEKINGDVYLDKVGRGDGVNQPSRSEAHITPATHLVDLRKPRLAPELRNGGTVATPGNNLSEQPHVEAAIPLSRHQRTGIEAGPSSLGRKEAAGNTASVDSFSSLDKDELPTKTSPSGWEIRRTNEGLIYFVDHDTGSSTWCDPWHLPDFFAILLPVEHGDLSRAADRDLKSMGFVKGWSKSGQVYFTDPQTRCTTRWDPRVFMKRLPFGVEYHAGRNGALHLSYERLGRRWSTIWESHSESYLTEIAETLEKFKAAADRVLDALYVSDTLSDDPRVVISTRDGKKDDEMKTRIGLTTSDIIMVENINRPFIQEMVREDEAFLEPLIEHSPKKCPDLAATLAWRFSAFERVWDWLPQRLIEHGHWDAECTWQRGIGDVDFHPILTFASGLRPMDNRTYRSKNRVDCRISFIACASGKLTQRYSIQLLITFCSRSSTTCSCRLPGSTSKPTRRPTTYD
jgi:hypothetical protein